jgi:hypothetical protein
MLAVFGMLAVAVTLAATVTPTFKRQKRRRGSRPPDRPAHFLPARSKRSSPAAWTGPERPPTSKRMDLKKGRLICAELRMSPRYRAHRAHRRCHEPARWHASGRSRGSGRRDNASRLAELPGELVHSDIEHGLCSSQRDEEQRPKGPDVLLHRDSTTDWNDGERARSTCANGGVGGSCRRPPPAHRVAMPATPPRKKRCATVDVFLRGVSAPTPP